MTRANMLVALVKRDLAGSIRVGYALAELHRDRLYEPQYRSWHYFLRAEFGISPRRARQLVAAADLLARLQGHDMPLPKNERVARPLLSLPEADQEVAWRACLATTPRRPVTAHHVESVCREHPRRRPAPHPRVTSLAVRFVRTRARPRRAPAQTPTTEETTAP